MITHVGEKRVSMGHPRLHPKYARPQRPPNFGDFGIRRVIKLDARKIVHGRPRMLTRDLFAVANFHVLPPPRSAVVMFLLCLVCSSACLCQISLKVIGKF